MAAGRLLPHQIPKTRPLAAALVRPSFFRAVPASVATQTRHFTRHEHTTFAYPITFKKQISSAQVHPRHNSTAAAVKPAHEVKLYDFADVKTFAESPSPDRFLIDVREPSEYAEGFIPTAINLPLKTAPDALLLPPDEFQDRFGFPKPSLDREVVLYCRSGVRSGTAARLAEQAGYQRIAEYKGSWLDWAAQGGAVGRV